MTSMSGGPRFTDRLGYRVAFLLAIVLLPLTMISVARSFAVMEQSRARSEAALMGETMRAASGELRLIQQARGSATVLADAIWPLVEDNEECIGLVTRLIEEQPHYSLVAYVPADGVSTCNSAGKRFDFTNDPLFLRDSRNRDTSFAVKARGLVSGASVLVISHPVFGDDGSNQGMVSLSLPHSGLRIAEDSGSDEHQPLTMITFDSSGTVLTASQELDDISLAMPRDRALADLTGDSAFSFSGLSAGGPARVFSVVPLVPDELYALGSWPPGGDTQTSGLFTSVPVLFPILMWFASLGVAWLAVERLVIRHIRKLRHSLITFAGGNRIVGDIDMTGASVEIREIADAYESMTETILHDEAELEDMVHQKEVLLREVHHRVKNNLQLIASIMNMQMRRTQSGEAKRTLKGLQDRVMSLATIHRELYQTAGLSDIHSDELLSTIVRQITNMTDRPDRRFEVHTDFADIRMTPDQAVPLALLVAEAVTNAIKYAAGAPGKPAQLWVSLTRLSEDRASVQVRNTVADEEAPAPGDDLDATGLSGRTGMGTQLVTAFAMQLGGTARRERADGHHDLTVEFEVRPLADAEQRHAEDGDPVAVAEPAG
ncbi:MAG: histidine kinase [Maritimibacter sp.]|nr:histidine kinase [Maritimibacter sp.]